MKKYFLQIFLVGLVLLANNQAQAQKETEKTPIIKHFDGTITATTNGISIIPFFSLGRPAFLFDMSLGGDRFSFDPMMRFGMNGKPWSFVFWWRYKIVNNPKFSLRVGAHPAFLFQERELIVDGQPKNVLVANRYLTWELAPTYKISPRSSLGIYFLNGNGINPYPPDHTYFLGVTWALSNFPLSKTLRFAMTPQMYYLKVDKNDGLYVTSTFTLTKTDFPIGLQSTFNQKIKSTIEGDDFVWNLSLIYNFANDYRKQ
ncbi:hypothetical protein JYB62_05060 [Algoriphagus lutimaris]|uniref:hypothetical protein n=1 Tax=Algoriphagus lutimaris TaxID=613197 RepID=UPI00196B52D0|nr:hypothetical protein [Algoriphagus lutimaris]MBN3519363.1 hypothetical protein [Algoriphagus lutimaris]